MKSIAGVDMRTGDVVYIGDGGLYYTFAGSGVVLPVDVKVYGLIGVSMRFSDYQTNAMKTAVYPKNIGILYTALGLAGEAGEVANKVKKIYRDDNGKLTDDRKAKIMKELAGALWYVAAMCTEMDVDLNDLANLSLDELQLRQVRGTLKGDGDNR